MQDNLNGPDFSLSMNLQKRSAKQWKRLLYSTIDQVRGNSFVLRGRARESTVKTQITFLCSSVSLMSDINSRATSTVRSPNEG